jgi:probable phosphoglycerate mutase
MNYKIYLFRHGQTTYNRDKRFTGHNDAKLTKLGKKQARIISNKLKKVNFGIGIHSKLSRSKETLKIVLKYHPECRYLIEDNRIIERDYGKLNGTLHSSFIKNNGINLFDKYHRNYYTPPPGGESFAMVEKRVKAFIKDLKKLIKQEKCNVAISAHGNSIRLFRKIMEKASIRKTISWTIPYDKYFEYTIKI